MARRMASERVSAEEHDVRGKHDSSDADPERLAARRRIREPHSLPNVVREEDEKEKRDVQEIAMDVLDDQREVPLAEICLARLANCARRRIEPEGFVIRAAIVVAGESEQSRPPE